jgi:hypothetical protein
MGTDTATALAYERALDTVLADSFPASDPPPWTFGIRPDRAQRAGVSSRVTPAWRRRLATGVGVIGTIVGANVVVLPFRFSSSESRWRSYGVRSCRRPCGGGEILPSTCQSDKVAF